MEVYITEQKSDNDAKVNKLAIFALFAYSKVSIKRPVLLNDLV